MYGSKLVQQLINKVMVDGKKSTAEKIVYDALDILANFIIPYIRDNNAR